MIKINKKYHRPIDLVNRSMKNIIYLIHIKDYAIIDIIPSLSLFFSF